MRKSTLSSLSVRILASSSCRILSCSHNLLSLTWGDNHKQQSELNPLKYTNISKRGPTENILPLFHIQHFPLLKIFISINSKHPRQFWCHYLQKQTAFSQWKMGYGVRARVRERRKLQKCLVYGLLHTACLFSTLFIIPSN